MGLIQEFQKADTERRREVKQIQDEVASMRSNVTTMLKDLAQGDRERASNVGDYLHAGVGKIRSEVADLFKDLAKEDSERAADVAAIAKEATAIIEEADTFLKGLARGSARRRSEVASIHAMVWGKAPTVRKVAPLVKDLPGKSAIETTPNSELRDKVFTYLTNHPDGTRLTELEEEFGVARIQTARVVRELMDGNKVEKRDLLYFVI